MSDEVDGFIADLLQPAVDPHDGFPDEVMQSIARRGFARQILLIGAVGFGFLVSMVLIYPTLQGSVEWMVSFSFSVPPMLEGGSIVELVSRTTQMWLISAVVMLMIMMSLLLDT